MNLHLDIGGEGRYPLAYNINPFSSTGANGAAFPRVIRSLGEQLPIRSGSVHRITVENTPLRPGIEHEIIRVLAPGGIVELDHPADYAAEAHQPIIAAMQARGAIDLLTISGTQGSVRTRVSLR